MTKPEAMRVWLLGGFRVSVGARIIEGGEWRPRKAAVLIKLLSLASGHRLHREQAMDLLWPHLNKGAANNLRQVLHGARRIIDPTNGSRYLASDGESLVLCPGGELWVDADAFEVAAMTARRAQEPAAHRAAIDLYAGELLPEDRYEAWAENRREELRQLYLALLVGQAKLHEERDEYVPAFDALRKATTKRRTKRCSSYLESWTITATWRPPSTAWEAWPSHRATTSGRGRSWRRTWQCSGG